MLLEKIRNDLKEALKAQDKARVSALRFLVSQIQNKAIEKQKELSEEEVIRVIDKQVKERKESIEAFKSGGREDLVEKEQAELEILSKYLPQQITEEEVKLLVDQVVRKMGAKGPSDFGKVMGAMMAKVKGRAQGQTVAKLVNERLAEEK